MSQMEFSGLALSLYLSGLLVIVVVVHRDGRPRARRRRLVAKRASLLQQCGLVD
jgi:hypothetical protein